MGIVANDCLVVVCCVACGDKLQVPRVAVRHDSCLDGVRQGGLLHIVEERFHQKKTLSAAAVLGAIVSTILVASLQPGSFSAIASQKPCRSVVASKPSMSTL